MSKEVLLWWDGPLQPEEGVVLHTGLPQVFTCPIVHHVETQQRLPGLSLCAGRRKKHFHSACEETVGDQYSVNRNARKDTYMQ